MCYHSHKPRPDYCVADTNYESMSEKHSQEIVFANTTHCVLTTKVFTICNQYPFPLFALDHDHGRGVAVAYAVVGNETHGVLEKGFSILKNLQLISS